MIRHWPGKADANGQILCAAQPCHGFMLAPGVPSFHEAANASGVLVPGSFPVRVRPRGNREILPMRNSNALYFEKEFPAFDILDCDPGDCWDVFTFDTREDGIMLAAGKGIVGVSIQPVATALPTANPTLVTDGFPLRPNMKNFTMYFSGTPRVNRLWVLTVAGVWFDTGEDYDQTATTDRLLPFTIGVPGQRWAMVASGAAQNAMIDAAMEVG